MFECIYIDIDLAINLMLKSIVEVKSYKLYLQVESILRAKLILL